jgi:hypothetical protein
MSAYVSASKQIQIPALNSKCIFLKRILINLVGQILHTYIKTWGVCTITTFKNILKLSQCMYLMYNINNNVAPESSNSNIISTSLYYRS